MKAESKQYTEKAQKEIQLEKQASSKQAEKTEKKAKKGKAVMAHRGTPVNFFTSTR